MAQPAGRDRVPGGGDETRPCPAGRGGSRAFRDRPARGPDRCGGPATARAVRRERDRHDREGRQAVPAPAPAREPRRLPARRGRRALALLRGLAGGGRRHRGAGHQYRPRLLHRAAGGPIRRGLAVARDALGPRSPRRAHPGPARRGSRPGRHRADRGRRCGPGRHPAGRGVEPGRRRVDPHGGIRAGGQVGTAGRRGGTPRGARVDAVPGHAGHPRERCGCRGRDRRGERIAGYRLGTLASRRPIRRGRPWNGAWAACPAKWSGRSWGWPFSWPASASQPARISAS